MLRPSYSELMEIVNKDATTDNRIASRYSIVIAAAKRARQIIDGAEHDATGLRTDKAVSVAIDEIKTGKIKIFPEGLVPEPEALESEKPSKPKIPRTAQGVGIEDGAERIADYDDTEDEYFGGGTAETPAARVGYDDEYSDEADAYTEEYDYGNDDDYDEDDYNYENEGSDGI